MSLSTRHEQRKKEMNQRHLGSKLSTIETCLDHVIKEGIRRIGCKAANGAKAIERNYTDTHVLFYSHSNDSINISISLTKSTNTSLASQVRILTRLQCSRSKFTCQGGEGV